MRLVAFDKSGKPGLGLRQENKLIDLARLDAAWPDDLADLLRQGPQAMVKLREQAAAAPVSDWQDFASLKLLPPTMRAGKIICLGLNYVDHAAESGFTKPEYPVLFMRAATSLVAHGEAIIRPRCSEQLDFEGEMVAFVGKTGRHIAKADALTHIAGYSVFNDASIRDYQLRTPQWTIGKNFDATGGFGPEFVSADEVPPGAKGLKIQTRLNGAVVQDANTSDMVFDVEETVAILSECITLEAGDVLVMGTPAGVGLGRKPPLWMKPGDVCEVEIERIGLLRNPIRQEG